MKCRVANKIRNAAAAANDTLAAKTEPAVIGLVVMVFLITGYALSLVCRIASSNEELLSFFQHGKYMSTNLIDHRQIMICGSVDHTAVGVES